MKQQFSAKGGSASGGKKFMSFVFMFVNKIKSFKLSRSAKNKMRLNVLRAQKYSFQFAKSRVAMGSLLTLLLVVGGVSILEHVLTARAISTATQSDWSGGANPGALANISGWTQYDSKDTEVEALSTKVGLKDMAVTQSEPDPTVLTSPDIRAYWKFDEASGASVTDYSGNGLTATFNDGIGHRTTGYTGVNKSANISDGYNEWIKAPNSSLLRLTSAITLETWFKPTSQSSVVQDIIDYSCPGGAGAQGGYVMYMDTSGYAHFATYASSSIYDVSSASTGIPLLKDNWYHLVGVYDGSADTLSLYVNGQLVHQIAQPEDIVYNNCYSHANTRFIIGNAYAATRFNDPLRPVFGNIDNIVVYGKALSTDEVKDSLNSSSTTDRYVQLVQNGASARVLVSNAIDLGDSDPLLLSYDLTLAKSAASYSPVGTGGLMVSFSTSTDNFSYTPYTDFTESGGYLSSLTSGRYIKYKLTFPNDGIIDQEVNSLNISFTFAPIITEIRPIYAFGNEYVAILGRHFDTSGSVDFLPAGTPMTTAYYSDEYIIAQLPPTATLVSGDIRVTTAGGSDIQSFNLRSTPTIFITNAAGTPQTSFNFGDSVYIKVVDEDLPASPSVSVTLTSNNGDTYAFSVPVTGTPGTFLSTTGVLLESNPATVDTIIQANPGTNALTVSFTDSTNSQNKLFSQSEFSGTNSASDTSTISVGNNSYTSTNGNIYFKSNSFTIGRSDTVNSATSINSFNTNSNKLIYQLSDGYNGSIVIFANDGDGVYGQRFDSNGSALWNSGLPVQLVSLTGTGTKFSFYVDGTDFYLAYRDSIDNGVNKYLIDDPSTPIWSQPTADVLITPGNQALVNLPASGIFMFQDFTTGEVMLYGSTSGANFGPAGSANADELVQIIMEGQATTVSNGTSGTDLFVRYYSFSGPQFTATISDADRSGFNIVTKGNSSGSGLFVSYTSATTGRPMLASLDGFGTTLWNIELSTTTVLAGTFPNVIYDSTTTKAYVAWQLTASTSMIQIVDSSGNLNTRLSAVSNLGAFNINTTSNQSLSGDGYGGLFITGTCVTACVGTNGDAKIALVDQFGNIQYVIAPSNPISSDLGLAITYTTGGKASLVTVRDTATTGRFEYQVVNPRYNTLSDGIFDSTTYDLGTVNTSGIWTNFEAGITNPAGTTFTFAFNSSAPGGAGTFYPAPVNTSDIPSLSAIESTLNPGRYMKYELTMSTTDATVSPEFSYGTLHATIDNTVIDTANVNTPPPPPGAIEITDNTFTPVSTFTLGDVLYLQATDAALNLNAGAIETVSVIVTSSTGDSVQNVILTESGINTGVFQGSLTTSTGAIDVTDGILQGTNGDLIRAFPSISFASAIDNFGAYTCNTGCGFSTSIQGNWSESFTADTKLTLGLGHTDNTSNTKFLTKLLDKSVNLKGMVAIKSISPAKSFSSTDALILDINQTDKLSFSSLEALFSAFGITLKGTNLRVILLSGGNTGGAYVDLDPATFTDNVWFTNGIPRSSFINFSGAYTPISSFTNAINWSLVTNVAILAIVGDGTTVANPVVPTLTVSIDNVAKSYYDQVTTTVPFVASPHANWVKGTSEAIDWPQGSGATHFVQIAYAGITDDCTLTATYTNTATTGLITSSTFNDGRFIWTIPTAAIGNNKQICIADVNNLATTFTPAITDPINIINANHSTFTFTDENEYEAIADPSKIGFTNGKLQLKPISNSPFVTPAFDFSITNQFKAVSGETTFTGGNLELNKSPIGIPTPRINPIYSTAHELIMTDSTSLMRIDAGDGTRITDTGTDSVPGGGSQAVDSLGVVWYVSDSTLYKVTSPVFPATDSTFTSEPLLANGDPFSPSSIVIGPDDSVWIGGNRFGCSGTCYETGLLKVDNSSPATQTFFDYGLGEQPGFSFVPLVINATKNSNRIISSVVSIADFSGKIYILNPSTSDIVMLDATNSIYTPVGLFVDVDDAVWVTNSDLSDLFSSSSLVNANIVKITNVGSVTPTIDVFTVPANFAPEDLVLTGNQLIFVGFNPFDFAPDNHGITYFCDISSNNTDCSTATGVDLGVVPVTSPPIPLLGIDLDNAGVAWVAAGSGGDLYSMPNSSAVVDCGLGQNCYDYSFSGTGMLGDFSGFQNTITTSQSDTPEVYDASAVFATTQFNHFDVSGWFDMTGPNPFTASFTTNPTTTDINVLVSFDGKASDDTSKIWKYYDTGNSQWANSNINTFTSSNSNTLTELNVFTLTEWGTDGLGVSNGNGGFIPQTTAAIDFAFKFTSTDNAQTPTLSNIIFNYERAEYIPNTDHPEIQPKITTAPITFTTAQPIRAFSVYNGFNNHGTFKFVLSPDNGATWYWYNSGWTLTLGNTNSEASTPEDVNRYIDLFTTSVSACGTGNCDFLWKVFVTSGSIAQLENVNVGYGTAIIPPTGGGTNPITAPTISVGTPLYSSSTNTHYIRWNFTDNSGNETGFRLVDGSGSTLISAPLPDISFIDEVGLTPNTLYSSANSTDSRFSSRYIQAYNNQTTSQNAGPYPQLCTLANTPGMPTVSDNGNNSLLVNFDLNGNPDGINGTIDTKLAIQVLAGSNPVQYVQDASGTLGNSISYLPYTVWGGTSGLIVGNLTGQLSDYQFKITAQNCDGLNTGFSPAGSINTQFPTEPVTLRKGVQLIPNNSLVRGVSVAGASEKQAMNGAVAVATLQSVAMVHQMVNILLAILIALFIFSLLTIFKSFDGVNIGENKLFLIPKILKAEASEFFGEYSTKFANGTHEYSFAHHKRLQTLSRTSLYSGAGLVALKVALVLVVALFGANLKKSIASTYCFTNCDQVYPKVLPGDSLSYYIEYTNNTDQVIVPAVITDPLDADTTYSSLSAVLNGTVGTSGQGITPRVNGNTLSFDLGAVPAKGTGFITFNVKINDKGSGVISNQVTLNGQLQASAVGGPVTATSNVVSLTITPPPPIVPPVVPPIVPPVVPPTVPPTTTPGTTTPGTTTPGTTTPGTTTPGTTTPGTTTPGTTPGTTTGTTPGATEPSTLEKILGPLSFLARLDDWIDSIFPFLNSPKVEKTIEQIITPIMLGLSAAITIPAFIAGAFNVLPYLHLLFLEPLMAFFGKRRNKYGIVYNALTKVPVDLAVIRIYDAKTKKLVSTKITDKLGRFYALTKTGEYYLAVTKPGFIYPTVYLKDDKQDNKFADVYHGEKIQVTEDGTPITVSIPLDPKEKVAYQESAEIRKFLTEKFKAFVPVSGIVLAIVGTIIYPTLLMFGFLALHIVMYLTFRRIGNLRRPKSWGVVYDEKSKKPIRSAVVRIFDTRFNKLLETYVTDGSGRYNFLVGPNQYQVMGVKNGYMDYKTKSLDLTKVSAQEAVVAEDFKLQKQGIAQVVGEDIPLKQQEFTKPSNPTMHIESDQPVTPAQPEHEHKEISDPSKAGKIDLGNL